MDSSTETAILSEGTASMWKKIRDGMLVLVAFTTLFLLVEVYRLRKQVQTLSTAQLNDEDVQFITELLPARLMENVNVALTEFKNSQTALHKSRTDGSKLKNDHSSRLQIEEVFDEENDANNANNANDVNDVNDVNDEQ